MDAARFAYIALSLSAVFFCVQSPLAQSFWMLAVVLILGALVYELGVRSIRQRLVGWPADLENARALLRRVADKAQADEIMSMQFGHMSDDLRERLEFVENPGWELRRFNDRSLAVSYAYLREQVVGLLELVRTYMSVEDFGCGGVMLPLEWRHAEYDSPLHLSYRRVQKELRESGGKVVVAIEAFANCLEGASGRLRG